MTKAINMQPLWDGKGNVNPKAMTTPKPPPLLQSNRKLRVTKPQPGNPPRLRTVK